MKIKFNEVSLSELEREYKAKVEADKCSYKKDKKNNMKDGNFVFFIIFFPLATLFLFFLFSVFIYQDFFPVIAFLMSIFSIGSIIVGIISYCNDNKANRVKYAEVQELFANHIKKLKAIAHCDEVLDLELDDQLLIFTVSQGGLVEQIAFKSDLPSISIRSDISTININLENYNDLSIQVPYDSLIKPYTTNNYGKLLEGKVNFEFDKNEAKNWIVD